MTTIPNKPKYYQEAERLLGIKEISGKKANPEIVELYKDAGVPQTSDEVPWCAGFVNACLVRGNKKGTQSLVARDFLLDKHKKIFTHLKKPEPYCIGVMQRGNSSWEGHVGFVVAADAKYVTLLGGNQADSVSVQRYARSKFLGFVKPKEDSTDVPVSQIKKDSRRLQTENWYQRFLAFFGIGTVATWDQIKGFATDNVGLIILGTIAGAFLISRIMTWMSVREYQQGRYLPSGQE